MASHARMKGCMARHKDIMKRTLSQSHRVSCLDGLPKFSRNHTRTTSSSIQNNVVSRWRPLERARSYSSRSLSRQDLFFVSSLTRKTGATPSSYVQIQRRDFSLSEAVTRRVETMRLRHDEIVKQLNASHEGESSSTASSMGIVSGSLGKELSTLAPVASLQERYTQLQEELSSMEDLLEEAMQEKDKELETECHAEIQRIHSIQARLEQRIVNAVLPQDEDDHGTDAVLEIRAGAGGDEASLFAGELLSAYEKAAKLKGWKFELLSLGTTDLGGTKEAAVSISSTGGGGGGYSSSYNNDDDFAEDDSEQDQSIDMIESLGPYGLFRFESGAHRVQRVPVNDVRIQTSVCSVAVLPSMGPSASSDGLLPMSELRIETMRSSGAGGQHVNCTDSAVRITHIATGITASIQDERSQHKNKAKALKLVSARVRDGVRKREAQERGDARNSLMGGGDRSERIRTYNFPQDRVTDHRCKHSEHGISKLLDGASDGGLVSAFAPPMRVLYRDELLKELEEEEEQNDSNRRNKTKK
eukprot:scaffold694834_cov67-Attheya_sp.AAC.1